MRSLHQRIGGCSLSEKVVGCDIQSYFVAETKGTNDINDELLRGGERAKIVAGKEHFVAIDVPYVAPVIDLQTAAAKVKHIK